MYPILQQDLCVIQVPNLFEDNFQICYCVPYGGHLHLHNMGKEKRNRFLQLLTPKKTIEIIKL